MASDIEIINRALTWISEEQITNLAEDRAAARAAAVCYPSCRDGLTADYPWRFALTRALVAAEVDPPAFGWSYAYTIPADWLRVWQVATFWAPFANSWEWNSVATTDGVPSGFYPFDYNTWEMEGNKVLTNLTGPLPIRGVQKITDPTQFPPIFVDALVAKLAKELEPRVAGTDGSFARLDSEYQNYIKRAKRSNAMEQPRMQQNDGRWTSARFRG